MRKTKEVLRLKFELGLGLRQIARSWSHPFKRQRRFRGRECGRFRLQDISCILTTSVVDWLTWVVQRDGASKINQAGTSDHGGPLAPGALFYPGDSRIAAAKEKACVHDSADDGLPPRSQESSSRVKKIATAFIFEAAVSREGAQRRLVDELLSVFGGRSRPIMAHLIESGSLTLEDVRDAEKALLKLAGEEKQK